MWNNIGRKLQSLAQLACWLGIIGAGIIALVIWLQMPFTLPVFLMGLLVLLLGGFGSWIGSWALYGFGVIVDKFENGVDVSFTHPNATEPQSRNNQVDNKVQETKSYEVKAENSVQGTKTYEAKGNEDKFVRCPYCNHRMSIDYVKARKNNCECPECGSKKEEKFT